MSTDKHRRWTTVLDNSAADRAAGRDMTGWVGVSDATDAEFKAGKVHGRTVNADSHCTPDCPGDHGAARLAELSARFRTTGLTPEEVRELHNLSDKAETRAWAELGMRKPNRKR